MTKEELEKEAEKYADTVKCEWENDTYWVDCRDKVTDAYLAGAEPREKRIAELEKENAELKKQLEMSNKVYNDNLDYSHHIEEQLSNAKDLLKQWLQTTKASGCDNINIVTDTEQFLKEVEK